MVRNTHYPEKIKTNKMQNMPIVPMAPSLGSNQYITKFDEAKRKSKRRFKISRKVKFLVLLVILASFYANYYLLKTNYVVTCVVKIGDVVQAQNMGHFMNKGRCDQISQDWFDARNNAITLRENSDQ